MNTSSQTDDAGRINISNTPDSLRQTALPAGNTRAAIIAIIAISVAASAFLFWLVYVHQAPAAFAHRLSFLPALNATFNGLSAIALTTGFLYIRSRRVIPHRNAMMTAFVFSSLFLVSYITNHALHGDQLFPRPRRYPHHLPLDPGHAYLSVRFCAAACPGHLLLLAQRPHPAASQNRSLDLPHLALRLRPPASSSAPCS